MAFAYGQLSLFLHNPGPVHMVAAERALAYVRGTHDQGLSYSDPGADNRNVLTGWVDSDFAADSYTRPASLDTSFSSTVPLSAGAVAAK